MLAPLYARVLVPAAVVEEMRRPATPTLVRDWISRPPDWLEVRPDPPSDPTLSRLDHGESTAISLALSLGAGRVLIDDWDGRAEAVRRNLSGTLAWASSSWHTGGDCSTLKRHSRASPRRISTCRRNLCASCGVGFRAARPIKLTIGLQVEQPATQDWRKLPDLLVLSTLPSRIWMMPIGVRGDVVLWVTSTIVLPCSWRRYSSTCPWRCAARGRRGAAG